VGGMGQTIDLNQCARSDLPDEQSHQAGHGLQHGLIGVCLRVQIQTFCSTTFTSANVLGNDFLAISRRYALRATGWAR
jgi:hypothetical protein